MRIVWYRVVHTDSNNCLRIKCNYIVLEVTSIDTACARGALLAIYCVRVDKKSVANYLKIHSGNFKT